MPPAHTTNLVAMALCTGEPSQVIEISPSPSWRVFCHLMFNTKDIFPSAAVMLSGQPGHPLVPAVTLC